MSQNDCESEGEGINPLELMDMIRRSTNANAELLRRKRIGKDLRENFERFQDLDTINEDEVWEKPSPCKAAKTCPQQETSACGMGNQEINWADTSDSDDDDDDNQCGGPKSDGFCQSDKDRAEFENKLFSSDLDIDDDDIELFEMDVKEDLGDCQPCEEKRQVLEDQLAKFDFDFDDEGEGEEEVESAGEDCGCDGNTSNDEEICERLRSTPHMVNLHNCNDEYFKPTSNNLIRPASENLLKHRHNQFNICNSRPSSVLQKDFFKNKSLFGNKPIFINNVNSKLSLYRAVSQQMTGTFKSAQEYENLILKNTKKLNQTPTDDHPVLFADELSILACSLNIRIVIHNLITKLDVIVEPKPNASNITGDNEIKEIHLLLNLNNRFDSYTGRSVNIKQ